MSTPNTNLNSNDVKRTVLVSSLVETIIWLIISALYFAFVVAFFSSEYLTLAGLYFTYFFILMIFIQTIAHSKLMLANYENIFFEENNRITFEKRMPNGLVIRAPIERIDVLFLFNRFARLFIYYRENDNLYPKIVTRLWQDEAYYKDLENKLERVRPSRIVIVTQRRIITFLTILIIVGSSLVVFPYLFLVESVSDRTVFCLFNLFTMAWIVTSVALRLFCFVLGKIPLRPDKTG